MLFVFRVLRFDFFVELSFLRFLLFGSGFQSESVELASGDDDGEDADDEELVFEFDICNNRCVVNSTDSVVVVFVELTLVLFEVALCVSDAVSEKCKADLLESTAMFGLFNGHFLLFRRCPSAPHPPHFIVDRLDFCS